MRSAATDEASRLGSVSAQEAQHTASVATDKAKETVGEVRQGARELYEHTMAEVTAQADTQQRRIAGTLRGFSGELTALAESSQNRDTATALARDLAHYADRTAGWFEARSPEDVLAEVRTFAQRHPGQFLLISAGLGLLAGRVVRSMKDTAADEAERSSSSGPQGATPSASGAASLDTAPLGSESNPSVYPPEPGPRRQDGEPVGPIAEPALPDEDLPEPEDSIDVVPPARSVGGAVRGDRPGGQLP